MGWGIYIHIPFCRQKCFYCDFPSFAGRDHQMEAYTKALCCEIAAQGSFVKRQKAGAASTVYIGGGTPTALPMEQLTAIIRDVRQSFLLAEDAEFTIEANPGTVTKENLQQLRACGVNRLSFGIQSFEDVLLKRIGRIHTAKQAENAVKAAQAAGFSNVSLDLMYGLPGQSLEQLSASVEQALELQIQHISIYGLQVEAGTVFARQQEQGRLELPSEEMAEAMYDYMTETLPANGYERYEISNFARPGFESRHNLSYWQDVPYLGLGAAAHSYWQGQRLENTADPGRYTECVEHGWSPAHEEEPMTKEIAMEEFCFLALRTVRGLDAEKFAGKFGCPLETAYGEVLQRMRQKGLLEVENGFWRLTKLGMKYGNIVFEAFIR